MKNLLVTGGTGFFGRALLRYLNSEKTKKQGHFFNQVTILSRSPQRFQQKFPELAQFPWISLHEGDVLLPDSLPKRMRYHSILHAAADITDSGDMSPLQVFRQIVDGTENMLNFGVGCGAKRFLLTSSGGVYGPQPHSISNIPETQFTSIDTLNTANAYSIGKCQAEHLCVLFAAHYGIETVIARCFSFVGIDLPRNTHFAIGNFIRDALDRPEIVIHGDGSPLRSYMHQSDLAQWLLTLLQHGTPGGAYNVGSDEVYSILQVAHIFRDILAPQKAVVVKGASTQLASASNRYVPDITKARSEFDLQVTIRLGEAARLLKTHFDSFS